MRDSIRATKDSIAKDTLDTLYHDALDYYRDDRYSEALDILDKIYSIDPHYEDVGKLRESIRKKQNASQEEENLVTIRAWMKKGDAEERSGQKVLAVSYWKKALEINPNYAPAKAKIDEINQALAKKEFESGTIHYHNGELDEAIEAWGNALALDPTYKDRGLLLLMSKVELQMRKDKIAKLSAQGFDQYQQGRVEAALESYEELAALEPRNEEARRMTSKIKIQLGQAAFQAAQDAMAKRAYQEAVDQADRAMSYGYEVSRSSATKREALHAIELANRPPPPPKPKPVAVSTPTAPAPPPAASPEDQQASMVHYRQGMAAIRKKDFHLAAAELDIAYQLDPANERIYMARARAHQEWNATNAGQGPVQ